MLSSWQRNCESSPGSFDECRMAPSGHRPKTKPDDLGCESACTGCQNLHPPSPFKKDKDKEITKLCPRAGHKPAKDPLTTAWQMLGNIVKCPILWCSGKQKRDPGSISRIQSTPKFNHFYRAMPAHAYQCGWHPPMQCGQTYSHTGITTPASASVYMCAHNYAYAVVLMLKYV